VRAHRRTNCLSHTPVRAERRTKARLCNSSLLPHKLLIATCPAERVVGSTLPCAWRPLKENELLGKREGGGVRLMAYQGRSPASRHALLGCCSETGRVTHSSECERSTLNAVAQACGKLALHRSYEELESTVQSTGLPRREAPRAHQAATLRPARAHTSCSHAPMLFQENVIFYTAVAGCLPPEQTNAPYRHGR